MARLYESLENDGWVGILVDPEDETESGRTDLRSVVETFGSIE